MWRWTLCGAGCRWGLVASGCRKLFSTTTVQPLDVATRLRNIGIMAHIDAGKTTLTERMLFFSGCKRVAGDVDKGNTTTDFLEEEQRRGITIQSACVRFSWGHTHINLIDTPGHVDFTLEVERALRVLDGAVLVVDGVAGVQAQTETVWRQACRYQIPCVVFINKLDRVGASFRDAVESLRQQLGITPVPIAVPCSEGDQYPSDGSLVDLISMERVSWPTEDGGNCDRTPLSHDDESMWLEQRRELVELVANLDPELADLYLAADGEISVDAIPPSHLQSAIRRVTLRRVACPVMGGSALRNRGVQPVMDAVAAFLPSPLDAPPAKAHPLQQERKGRHSAREASAKCNSGGVTPKRPTDEDLSALAFKVTCDPQRGVIVFIRVYSGVLRPSSSLLNTTQLALGHKHNSKEKINKLFRIFADNVEPLEEVLAGDIAALVGLKNTATGDTLLSASHPAHKLYTLGGVPVPQPVFFCSVEPDNSAEQRAFDEGLRLLLLEDPSLRVQFNQETGQTLLSGMGELHLEVACGRLFGSLGVKGSRGKVEVSYRETVVSPETREVHVSKNIGGKTVGCRVHLHVQPLPSQSAVPGDEDQSHAETNRVEMDLGDADSQLLQESCFTGDSRRMADSLRGLKQGILDGLGRGPLLFFPLENVHVLVRKLEPDPSSDLSSSSMRVCGSLAIREVMKDIPCLLLEPVMSAKITCKSSDMGNVLNDISNMRRGRIRQLDTKDEMTTILADIPVEKMIGYSSGLRSLTQGTASFDAEFSQFSPMSSMDQQRLLQQFRGGV